MQKDSMKSGFPELFRRFGIFPGIFFYCIGQIHRELTQNEGALIQSQVGTWIAVYYANTYE